MIRKSNRRKGKAAKTLLKRIGQTILFLGREKSSFCVESKVVIDDQSSLMQDCWRRVFLNDYQVENQIMDSGKHVAEVDWRIGSLFEGEKKRTCVNALQGDINLLSRSMHDWRRGFRMIGKLACGDWIAANTLLKRFGDLVHYFEERAGVVSLHQKEVINLLSRSTHEWRRGFLMIGELTC